MKFQGWTGRIITIIVIAICLITPGCDKEEDEVPVIKNTIAGLILTNPEFSTLEALLAKANLAMIFDGPGPFTLFAPDDSAFVASGITVSMINSLTQQQAQTLLLYHTLNADVMIAGLPEGPNGKVTTFAGDSVFITKRSGNVYINGATVSHSNVVADNGIIHTIELVLNPPAGDIIQTSLVYGLDSLAKAISRATNDSTGSSELSRALDSTTLTLFAPTDSAFISLLTDLSLTDINDIPVNTLVAIIGYHLTSGRIFSTDFVDGPLTMSSGGETAINLANGINGGPTITGAGNNGTASNISKENILSRNAVLHFIDRVLIP